MSVFGGTQPNPLTIKITGVNAQIQMHPDIRCGEIGTINFAKDMAKDGRRVKDD